MSAQAGGRVTLVTGVPGSSKTTLAALLSHAAELLERRERGDFRLF